MKKHLRFFVASIMMLTCSMSFAQAYKTLSFSNEVVEPISSYDPKIRKQSQWQSQWQ